jgi:GNAT superfamily N-acetyltransferase
VIVRRAAPDDVDAWARLRVAMLVEEGLLAPGEDPAGMRTAVAAWLGERLETPAFGAFVADAGGQVVGSGGISIYDSPPGPGLATREAYIMSMYTDPAWRRRGVAGMVLAALLDWARAAGGVGRVWLRASAMGRPVYLRAGFEPRDSYLQILLD